MGKEFARHEMVDHGKDEYVSGDAHSNTVEGHFSVLKRGITGVYHHVWEAHLKRYLAEFDFRYSYRASVGVHDPLRHDMLLSPPSAANASPIGGLVKAVTPKQRLKKLKLVGKAWKTRQRLDSE